MSIRILAAWMLCCVTLPVSGQYTIRSVIDLNQRPLGLESSYLYGWGDKLVFSAYDFDAGYEPHLLSGDKVSLMADVNPGSSGSSPWGFTPFNDQLYFFGQYPGQGYLLLHYEGEKVGVIPGQQPYAWGTNPAQLTAYKGNLYFIGPSPENATGSLVKYDGQTVDYVRDPSTNAVINVQAILGILSDKLVLAGFARPIENSPILTFDGEKVTAIYSGVIGIEKMSGVVRDDYLYFGGKTIAEGWELWKTNGTTTSLVQDYTPGQASSIDAAGVQSLFAIAGENVYYYCKKTDGSKEVCIYDGATIKNISGQITNLPYSRVERIAGVGDRLFIVGKDIQNERAALYVYDGTNIKRWSEVDADAQLDYPGLLLAHGSALYVNTPGDKSKGNQIWKISGNETTRLTNVKGRTDDSGPAHLFTFKDKLYFTARDADSKYSVFVNDGANTRLFTYVDTNEDPTKYDFNDPFKGFLEYKDELYVRALHKSSPSLYKFNNDNAQLVSKDLNQVSDVVPLGNELIIATSGYSEKCNVLCSYDGMNLKSIKTEGNVVLREARFVIAFNGKVYFRGMDNDGGWELWSYDGVSAKRVVDYTPGSNGTPIQLLISHEGKLYVVLDWGTSGEGTKNGLYVLEDNTLKQVIKKEVRYGNNDRSYFASFGSKLYLSISDKYYGAYTLYSYDGNMITKVGDGNGLQDGRNFTVYNNRLFYKAWGSAGELYMLDGDRPVEVSSSYSDRLKNVGDIEVFNGELYFAASDRNYGNELWKMSMTGTDTEEDLLANRETILLDPFPNPTSDFTSLEYNIGKPSSVEISLYDMLGRRIRVIHEASQVVGRQSVRFNTNDLPGGVYFCRLVAGEVVDTKKLIVVH